MVPAVELTGVGKELGGQKVVRGVDLSIREGEFFSLLGPSGCGKTTTLRLIAGFETPDEGAIRIRGRGPGRRPAFAREVNLVFQNYALFPHMTVWANVAFGLEMERRPKEEIRREVEAILALVRLEGLEGRYPRQLSGGQQQRVALARALVTDPAVVLLDEPLGALDLKLRKDMQIELKALQRRTGVTFIYVTHDQEEALAMSDRIAVMHEGRVLQVGTPEEIYERPQTRFVAHFIGETNLLEGRLRPGGNGVVEVESDGLAFAVGGGGRSSGDEQVILTVRPEHLVVGRRLNGGLENRFAGEVVASAYHGSERMVHVRIGNGVVLRSRVPNGSAELPDPGDAVEVGWPAAAARLVSPD
ncbi:MAG: ABC transporter ATP-binding protein [Puniceicoccaceae bacterium]|nr:MAG: ABC transporter ATP-binding protein [Puniceicoccaceae bacterium]